jgi:predicted RNA-binding protein with RPS1 domain
MDLEGGIQGLIHLSEISHGVVKDIRDYVKVGEEVTAKIINFEPKKKRIGLSLKALQEAPEGTVKAKTEEEKIDEEVSEEKKSSKKVSKTVTTESETPAKKTTKKKVKDESETSDNGASEEA